MEYNGAPGVGYLVKIHAPAGDGRYIHLTYNANGLVTQAALKQGDETLQSVVYGYTDSGDYGWEATSVTDAGGGTVAYQYDSAPDPVVEGEFAGRHISRITDKLGNAYQLGTVMGNSPERGRQPLYVTVTYPDGLETKYHRFEGNEVHTDLTVTNTKNGATLNKFQTLCGPHGYRPAKYLFYAEPDDAPAEADAWTFEYGPDNLQMELRAIIAPDASVFAEYTYTDNGRLKTSRVGGGPLEEYHYAAGAIYPYSRTRDGSQTVSYIYDSQQRLEGIGGAAGAAAVTYDAAGDIATAQVNGGSSRTYIRDEWGNLERVEGGPDPEIRAYDALGNVIARHTVEPFVLELHDFADAAHPRKATRIETGLDTYFFSYDANGRVCTVVDPVNGIFDVAYDTSGRMTAVVNRGTQEAVRVIAYDALGRISDAIDTAQDLALSFGYDHLSRVNQVSDDAGNALAYTYGPTGKVTGTTLVSGTANLSLVV